MAVDSQVPGRISLALVHTFSLAPRMLLVRLQGCRIHSPVCYFQGLRAVYSQVDQKDILFLATLSRQNWQLSLVRHLCLRPGWGRV